MPRRVPKFHEFVGQKKHVDFLGRLLAGAMARNEPFPHTLFLGPSGIGKTLLSRQLAKEYGTDVVEAMGYEDREVLGRKLKGLHANDFLHVDECQRLGFPEQEMLCEAIDRKSIPEPDPERTDREAAGGGRASIQPWTLVLATDQPGRLLPALRKRIVNQVGLTYYPTRELKEIVEVLSDDADLLLSPQAARRIAEVAGGLPRLAKQLVQKLRLFHPDSEKRQLSIEDVREFLTAQGTDESGLDPMEQSYLAAVEELRGASLESLALMLGTDKAYVRSQIESALVRRGLVKIGPAGRQLTSSGRQLVDCERMHNSESLVEKDEDDDKDQGGSSAD